MTIEELNAEWRYRYHERIGMLCGTEDPTDWEKSIARQEADEAIEQLRQQEKDEHVSKCEDHRNRS